MLNAFSNLPEPDQFWSIRADEPHNHIAEKAVLKNGLVLSSPTRRANKPNLPDGAIRACWRTKPRNTKPANEGGPVSRQAGEDHQSEQL
jgi:hypothetical protein